MTTESQPTRTSEAGFTLIEVLIAMVILAVGLLALEALGIGAARSLAQAETKNDMVAAATAAIERTHKEIRTAPAPAAVPQTCGTDAATGLYVCTTVETSSTTGVPPGTARVTVSVRKSPTSTPFTLTSHVFDPQLP